MELNELKLICAGNLINLRTREGMTQAELGAKLNYSDKNISKWERGEALPDAFALTRIAEIFGVTVDYILTAHDKVEVVEGMPVEDNSPTYRASVVIAIAVLSILTSALTAFVILWLFGNIEWRIFLIGLSLSLLVALVLDGVFYKWKGASYITAAFVLSLFVLIYFAVTEANIWQVFLISVPAVALVFLAGNVRKKPKKTEKNNTK